jgi:lipopolysaccharide transport system permease protein
MTRKATVIRPTRGWRFVDPAEVWWYRDLFYFLVRRDVIAVYKQTVFGILWTVIQPLCTMVVLTVFLGLWVGMPNDGIPYPLLYFSALVPWQYFAGTLTRTSSSLVANVHLITKVYFPRVLLPLAPAVSRLVGFVIGMIVLLALMAGYGVWPGLGVLYMPLLVLIMLLCATGVGMWLTALNIQYRDIQFTVGFLVQLWMFATPVLYPYSMVPERYRLAYALNPMVGVIENFRGVLVGSGQMDWSLAGLSFLVSLVLFVSGLFYFSTVERLFADVA